MPPQLLQAATPDSGKAPSRIVANAELAVMVQNDDPALLPSLADDLLRGASEIAKFVFGNPRQRRAVYHLAVEVRPECRMPVFRLGNLICARRSTLLRWIARQEERVLVHPDGSGGP
jgi:hypothetical protein